MESYKDRAKIFKAFCDENRLQILDMLKSGEKCACKLVDELNISQSTLSHHMKILCDAEIVKGRKDGKWVHYSLDEDGAKRAEEMLKSMLTADVTGETDKADETNEVCKCR